MREKNLKRVFEPAILAIASFGMYISSLFAMLLIAALGGCSWKGACGAPVMEFGVLVFFHWLIVAAVMKQSIRLARWLLFIFGVIPFSIVLLMLVFSTVADSVSVSAPAYSYIITGYLFIFGALFPAYLFFSKGVAEYEKYIIASRNS